MASHGTLTQVDGAGITEFSVCMKGHDPEDLSSLMLDQPVYELYRLRLPPNRYSGRGVILGEGKPENQNHACIFAHHEGIQVGCGVHYAEGRRGECVRTGMTVCALTDDGGVHRVGGCVWCVLQCLAQPLVVKH